MEPLKEMIGPVYYNKLAGSFKQLYKPFPAEQFLKDMLEPLASLSAVRHLQCRTTDNEDFESSFVTHFSLCFMCVFRLWALWLKLVSTELYEFPTLEALPLLQESLWRVHNSPHITVQNPKS